MADDPRERAVNEFVKMMQGAAPDDLVALVMYGSAVRNDYSEKYSDINLLCVFKQLNPEVLAKISSAVQWWTRQGGAALVLTLDELDRSADVFPIEVLDIQAHHKRLFGNDVLSAIEVQASLHRLQVERELRMALIRLRQRYLDSRTDRRALLELMVASSSTFHTLLRHALIVLGHPAPEGREQLPEALRAVFGSDLSALNTVLDIRRGKIRERDVDAQSVFREYLASISAVIDRVDRQLAAK
jgi:hypothetical protein